METNKLTQVLSNTPSHTETDSMLNGNRTPSVRSQRSVSNEPQDSDTEGTRAQNPLTAHKPLSKEVVAQMPSRKRPSVKPKPPLNSSTSSDIPATSSSSHQSSDHVSSSSSHVGQVIERMESNGESKVASPRQHRSKRHAVLPSVSSMEQTSRPRTHTHPSPGTTPTMPRRLSGHTPHDCDLGGTLEKLKRLALTNDYYALLGVDAKATLEEVTRARREKSRLLHPDHFADQPDKKRR